MNLAQIKALLHTYGVTQAGICRFEDCLPLLPVRSAGRVPQGARSVIVCLFPWNIGPAGESVHRNVARYAVLPDYHSVAGDILSALATSLQAICPQDSFVPFVDSSPVREVAAAALAGLGVVGRHGLLIHPDYGTDVFVGEVVTTLELPPTRPPARAGQSPTDVACLDCGRCARACPTGALCGGGSLDLSRCRSHITQKKGLLTPWEEDQIRAGGLVWGCDRCTGACPMNTHALSPIAAFFHRPLPVLTRDNLRAALGEKAYGYRGRKLLERNLDILEQ